MLLLGSASKSALHTSVDVGLLSKQGGLHVLLCRFSAGRFPRHAAINNIIKRSLDTAGLHSILETVGLDWGNGRRPDGVMPFPFKGGKALAWDATCTDSFSANKQCSTILNPASTLSAAEDLKRQQYSQLVADFEFVPVVVETSWIIRSAGCSLLTDISRCILRATNDVLHPPTNFSHHHSGQSAVYIILIKELCPEINRMRMQKKFISTYCFLPAR